MDRVRPVGKEAWADAERKDAKGDEDESARDKASRRSTPAGVGAPPSRDAAPPSGEGQPSDTVYGRYWAMYQSKFSDAWRPWNVLSAFEGSWTATVTYADAPAVRPPAIARPLAELGYDVAKAFSVFVVSEKLHVAPVAPP